MDLKFRTLYADEIDVRSGSVNRGGVNLLLYKDARCDMSILDEHVGSLNWKREHEVIDGKLFCSVSIYDPEKKEWISKSDVGTESFTEKEKGESSDSFKRACVNWGVGRELYTSPPIFFYSNQLNNYRAENGKYKCYDTFSVTNIQYDEKRQIANVTIRDNESGVVITFGHPLPEPTEPSTQENVPSTPANAAPTAVPSDKELHERKKINEKQKDYLITECEKLYIKLEDLLALYKVTSLDDITLRQYDNTIKNRDTLLLQPTNPF